MFQSFRLISFLLSRAPLHQSATDNREHYTVDVYAKNTEYNIDQPIGCIHVYSGTSDPVSVYTNARAKALEVSFYADQ